MSFYCDICNKKYKSYHSLYSHNKKFHNDIIKNKKSESKQFECEYCSKVLSRKDSLQRHIKICKVKREKENSGQVKKLNKKLKVMESNDLEHIMKLIDTLSNNQVHNGDIINNSSNNSNNNNNNNIQNNIQNNINGPINITVNFGEENLSEVFSKAEQLAVLKKKANSLDYLIKYVHFNEKYPQFQNIKVDDLKSGNAMVYDESKKKFIVMRKKELYPNLIINRVGDIESFFIEHEEELEKKYKRPISKLLQKYEKEMDKENSSYINDKISHLDVLCYNERDIFNQSN